MGASADQYAMYGGQQVGLVKIWGTRTCEEICGLKVCIIYCVHSLTIASPKWQKYRLGLQTQYNKGRKKRVKCCDPSV